MHHLLVHLRFVLLPHYHHLPVTHHTPRARNAAHYSADAIFMLGSSFVWYVYHIRNVGCDTHGQNVKAPGIPSLSRFRLTTQLSKDLLPVRFHDSSSWSDHYRV